MRYLIGTMLILSMIVSGEIKLPVSFSADFIQKVTDKSNQAIRYSGKIYMNAPDTLKWVYIKPSKKEVCSDGAIVTVVEHDLEQVSFYRLDKSFNIYKLLSNAKHYKDNIYLASYKGKQYTIALDDKKRVEQIAYRDDMDNIVNIHFYNIKYSNTPINSSKLECPYPKNYDIVEG